VIPSLSAKVEQLRSFLRHSCLLTVYVIVPIGFVIYYDARTYNNVLLFTGSVVYNGSLESEKNLSEITFPRLGV